MQSKVSVVVVLGTGGTIAGTSADRADNIGYAAGQLPVASLLDAARAHDSGPVEAEQVAQVDSKDMSHAVWLRLAQRCAHHLARPEVRALVVTHGTDTLEETAWFLQRVLAPAKPLVMTAAMRPATALLSDGPQNLRDALAVARMPGARGVVAVLHGRIHGARDVRKLHPYRVDAFRSGDAGPIGMVEEGALRLFRSWPDGVAIGVDALPDDVAVWPRVEIVTSHAGASGALVRALGNDGVDGLVVAGTGNGTLHRELETALLDLQRNGIQVMRSSRCGGRVLTAPDAAIPAADDLTPAKARVELLLRLLAPQLQR